MTKKSSAAAVIEIGADQVRMRVSQLSKGAVATLDFLEYPIPLGHDVFETGSVSFDSLRELSGILEKFKRALRAYRIQKPKVISCSALRDAKNRAFVVDQLRVRNDLDVTILEESQEKAYLYSEITAGLSGTDVLKEGNSVIVHVGAGSIGVALYDGGKITYFQNISTGALKLQDVLEGIHNARDDFHLMMEEYLDTLLNHVFLPEVEISNLIFTGLEIELAAKLCGAKSYEYGYLLNAKRFTELYGSLRTLNPENIGMRYGITEQQAAVLYTSLSIYQAALRFCPDAETVCAPRVDISQALLRCMLSAKAETERAASFQKNALACAETTARRFGCDLQHSQKLREDCCLIFDRLKRVHGLDPSRRLILELAAILHSCGSFVSVRRRNRCTFDLIKGMDLFGLSESDVFATAFTAGAIAGDMGPDAPELLSLSAKERLSLSKLAAIFRMANALDKSHRQKLKELKVTVEEDRVQFKAKASGDTLLEQWAFSEAAKVFQEVFGLSPELSIKFDLL